MRDRRFRIQPDPREKINFQDKCVDNGNGFAIIFTMSLSGKYCRVSLIFVLLLISARIDAGIKIDFGDLFGSKSKGVLEDSSVREIAYSPQGSTRGSYLQVSQSPVVEYAAMSGEKERVDEFGDFSGAGDLPGELRSKEAEPRYPSYSAFLKQIKADRQASESAGVEADSPADEVSSTEGERSAFSAGDRLDETDGSKNADGSDGSGAASGVRVIDTDASALNEAGARPAEGAEIAGRERAVAAQGQLFSRPLQNEAEFSNILLFFPTDELDLGGLGNYNILTPVNQFDFFTTPSQPLPKSSTVYRTVP
jgi:hypothetical protein